MAVYKHFLLAIFLIYPAGALTAQTFERSSNKSSQSTPSLHQDFPLSHLRSWSSDTAGSQRQPSPAEADTVRDWHRTEFQRRLDRGEPPNVVRKMGDSDAGEKFWPEYYGYHDLTPPHLPRIEAEHMTTHNITNLSLRAPMFLHLPVRKRGISIPSLFRRGTCPAGYDACNSIGHPNSCCPPADTCIVITDTGLGPVGCCPAGLTCAGQISSCAASQTACPSSLGGGCCIAGFVCSGVGCVANVVVTVTSVLTLLASDGQTLISTTTITSTTAKQLSSSLSAAVTTIIVTVSSTALTTATAVAPARPTSAVASTTTIFSVATQTSSPLPLSINSATCPTGYYQCSAYYAGGCCQVDRECHTTYCPSTASSTLTSNSITVVVPLGTNAATSFASGTCAAGWSTCASAGVTGATAQGCCPSGWECGSASCTLAQATSTVVQGKEGSTFASGCRRTATLADWHIGDAILVTMVVAALGAYLA